MRSERPPVASGTSSPATLWTYLITPCELQLAAQSFPEPQKQQGPQTAIERPAWLRHVAGSRAHAASGLRSSGGHRQTGLRGHPGGVQLRGAGLPFFSLLGAAL